MPSEREALLKAMRENPEVADKLADFIERGTIMLSDVLNPDEPLVIICGPEHGGITGSKRVKCGCGIRIWISPSTQEVVARRGQSPTSLVCSSCAVRICENDRKAKKE